MKENGNAAMMSAFCSAVNPLAESKMSAIDACATPHVNFTTIWRLKGTISRLHSEYECSRIR